ncbi:hypothetical protein RD792_008101 [Penstemon davidsonii]|uniref:Glycosyltransferase n=1 Tax=Penstemon davidsonii TaxID=160366 RepID=A0ABR0D823_9LAMI|nr:hypothetical protein RD792_008101 [Penstemon davidsonii]
MEKSEVIAVIVPLPSQSHLNQLLQLSSVISSYTLPVHYLGSATHNRQAKLRAHGLNPKINFHDLPTPPIESPNPNPNTLDKIPSHLSPAIVAYMNLRHPITTLLQELSTKARRVVIIHDRLMAEAVEDAVLIPNVECYAYNCLSAFNLFYILWESLGKPIDVGEEINKLPSVKEFFPEEVLEFIVSKPENFKRRAGDIHNTSRLIEGNYIELLEREEINGNIKQWAITPTMKLNNTKTGHKCLDWLNKQDPRSVIYVSFGTSISISDEEAKEFAMGLELSKKKFVWVVRDADKTNIFDGEDRRIELPEGFEERVRDYGLVVRDWAPQIEILAHESIGGFMSHCGWNSCLESITMGVPIAALPMHSDQPLNALFLTEVLKIGVIVREWGERNEVVKASKIKNVVERLMGCEEGDEMRKRAKELSVEIKKSMEEGGEFCRELDAFIAHITR